MVCRKTHPIKLAIFLIALSTLFLQGCYSYVNVRVASVDRDMVENSERFKNAYRQNLQSELKARQAPFLKTIEDEIIGAFKQALRESPNFSDAAVRKVTIDTARVRLNKMLDKSQAFIDSASKKMNQLDLVSEIKKSQLIEIETLIQLSDRHIIMTAELAASDIADGLGNQNEATALKDKIATTTRSVLKPIKTSIYGSSIVDDAMASYVTGLPNKYWNKRKVEFKEYPSNSNKKKRKVTKATANKARVHTFLGNADIAIKMDEPGVFVIKGVRMDASEAFKTSFAMLNLGIKYMAYQGGLSVSDPASPDSPVAGEVGEVEENKQLKSTLRKEKQALNGDMKILMTYIFSNQDRLLPDNEASMNAADKANAETEREKAFAQIQGIFKSTFK